MSTRIPTVRLRAAVSALAATAVGIALTVAPVGGRDAAAQRPTTQRATTVVRCADAPDRIPVLLVHGWSSSSDTWAAGIDVLGADRRTCLELFDYRDQSFEWVTNPKIGAALAQRILELATGAAAKKVIVVAHSMGGLAIRCAASAECGGDPRIVPLLLDVITMGTPNHGTFLKGYLRSNLSNVLAPILTGADCLVVFSGHLPESTCAWLASVVTSPAAYAFTPGSRQEKALPQLPEQVPLYAIGGSVDVTTSFFGLNQTSIGNAGDLVVSQESAWAASRKVGEMGGRKEIDCGTIDLTTLGFLPGKLCWHGGEPSDDAFDTAALLQIRRAVDAGAVTKDDLGAAPVPSLRGNPAGTLRGGTLPNPAGGGYVTMALSGPVAPAFGELTGDGFDDAAAVISATSGAGGLDEYVGVYTKRNGTTVLLGDYDPDSADPNGYHASIKSMKTGDHAVQLTWTTYPGGTDPFIERWWSADLVVSGGQVHVRGLVARTAECPAVSFSTSGGDENGAFQVAATDLSCADAEPVIRAVDKAMPRPPPPSVKVQGWQCTITGKPPSESHLTTITVACSNGSKRLAWES